MTAAQDGRSLEPCPFCGNDGVSTREGDTYRWLLIGGTCGCCEIEIAKVDRALPHDHPTNLSSAYEAWNRRPQPSPNVAEVVVMELSAALLHTTSETAVVRKTDLRRAIALLSLRAPAQGEK